MTSSVTPSGSGSATTPPGGIPQQVSMLDLAYVLASGARLLMIVPLASAIIVIGITFLFSPYFSSTVTIMPPQQQQSSAMAVLGSLGGLAGLGGGGGASALAGLKNPNDQWVGLLKSRTIADALIERFKLKDRYDDTYMFEAREHLAKLSKIESGKDNLIDISVEDHDPKTAADIATAYVEELQKLSKDMAVTEAGQRRLFFERQLQEGKVKLVAAEQALRSSGISTNVMKASPDAAVGELAFIKAQVAASEVRVGILQGSMTNASPELQLARRELALMREQLRKAEQAEPMANDNAPGKAAAKNSTGTGTGTGKSGADSDYIARFREFKYQETLFELTAKQYELAKADEARDGAVIQIVDTAYLPEWKSRPKRAVIGAITFLATAILVVLYLFCRQAYRNACADPYGSARLRDIRSMLRRRRRAAQSD